MLGTMKPHSRFFWEGDGGPVTLQGEMRFISSAPHPPLNPFCATAPHASASLTPQPCDAVPTAQEVVGSGAGRWHAEPAAPSSCQDLCSRRTSPMTRALLCCLVCVPLSAGA